MSKSFCYRLYQTTLSCNVLFGTLVGLIILMWFSVANWIQYRQFAGDITYAAMCGEFIDAIYNSHARSGFNLFAPILAVLPGACLFCNDYNSEYLNSILIRSSKRKYIRDTILCCSLSGGLAVFLPELISSTIFMCVGEPHLPSEYENFLDQSIFADLQYIWEGRYVVFLFLLFSFLFGMVWSSVGLCISAYIPNRYVALAAPFAIYYGVHLVLNRTQFLAILSPANMIQPISALLPNIAFPIIYQLILLCVSIVLFCRKVQWRLENA